MVCIWGVLLLLLSLLQLWLLLPLFFILTVSIVGMILVGVLRLLEPVLGEPQQRLPLSGTMVAAPTVAGCRSETGINRCIHTCVYIYT